MVSMVYRLCRDEFYSLTCDEIETLISDYFDEISKVDIDVANRQLQVFMSSSAPAALVMLYISLSRVIKVLGSVALCIS